MVLLLSVADETLDDVVRIMEAEYREMPGLNLTEIQVRRLWNLDADCCGRALARLVGVGFLVRTPHGTYARRSPAA